MTNWGILFMNSEPLIIAIIDDDELMLRSLVRYFKVSVPDAQINTFSSPVEFIKELSRFVRLDLVVTDYLMPKVNGLELIEQTRQHFKNTLSVLLTGDTSGQILTPSSLATTFIIAKPFKKSDLDEVLIAADRLSTLKLPKELELALIDTFIINDFPLLLNKLDDVDLDFKKLTKLLEKELVIQAKLFHLCNTAYVGLSTKKYSLETAIKTLGIDLVSAIITATCFQSMVTAHYTIHDCEQRIENNFKKVKLLKEIVNRTPAMEVNKEQMVFIESLLFLGELGEEIANICGFRELQNYAEKLKISVFIATHIGYEANLISTLGLMYDTFCAGLPDNNESVRLLLLVDTVDNKQLHADIITTHFQDSPAWLEHFYELRQNYFA